MSLSQLKEAVAYLKNLRVESEKLPTRKYQPKVYKAPSLDTLKGYPCEPGVALVDPTVLESRMREFGIPGTVENIRKGPMVSRYEVRLGTGVRLNKVRSISEDLSVALAGRVRILAPIPGTSLVGFEVVNDNPSTVGLKNILSSVGTQILPVPIGVDTVGNPKIADLTTMPHLLVAGVTGSGKSVFLNSLIMSLVCTRTPEQVRLVLIDPKRVELSAFKNIPHLAREVVTEVTEALEVFVWLVAEMERRYRLLESVGARNISAYNSMEDGKLPYIVCVVDEMADLMMTAGKPLEGLIVRIAQLARAVGIHLVLATQKPVVKVITGLIKSNVPSRISFQVSSKIDSRVILDTNGAEQLAGRGDMLYIGPGLQEPERYHGAWVSDEEIRSIVKEVSNE